ALLFVRRRTVPALIGGVLTAITAISAYSLATRLFPDRIGTFDPLAVYRLEEPIGYWNALGIFADMDVLLALGVAARGRSTIAPADHRRSHTRRTTRSSQIRNWIRTT